MVCGLAFKNNNRFFCNDDGDVNQEDLPHIRGSGVFPHSPLHSRISISYISEKVGGGGQEIHTSHNHPNRKIQFCSSCKQEAVSKKMPSKSDEVGESFP